MLKKLFFLNVVLLCWQVVTVHAQSISPNVISSAGTTATGGTSIINYNVGEPVIGTLTGGSYQITQGFEQPGGVNSTLLTGLVSYWRLDETSGQAIDVAGGGNNGTNTSVTQGVAGKINTAYSYNGSPSGTLMTNAPNLSFSTSGSLSAWVQIPAIHTGDVNSYYFGAIVCKENHVTDKNGYYIFYDSYFNTFVGELANGTSAQSFSFSGVTVTTNTWIHLVVTWNGTTITTYMNGSHALSVPETVTPVSNVYPFSIGYQAATNAEYYRGPIDEVGSWNRALTAKEDSLLYAAGFANPYPFDGSGNVPPTANAGINQTLPNNTTNTTLSGSGTGTAITYAWTRLSGGSVTITTPNAATTTLTGLSAGAYSFQLTVSDNLGNTAQSTVSVTVNPAPLTANAGTNQILVYGTTSTTLYGSGAGSGITYGWAQTAGPGTATITSPTQASTTLTGLATGAYTFRLTVTDVLNNTATSNVNVTILSSGSGSSLLNGLISYWNLNDTSGLAIDNAGGGNNGTNNRVRQGVAGKMNTAYLYPGSPSGTLMTNAPNLSFTTSGSLSAWVQIPLVATGYTYPGVPGGYYFGDIVNKENRSADVNGYTIFYDSYYNNFQGDFANANAFQGFAFSGPTVTANTWIHLVVTWDGTTITTYMNGANANSVPQTVIPVSNVYPFAIGFQAVNNGEFFRGSIDEVGAWNRALTAQEAASLYAAGTGNPYPFIGPLPTANAGSNQTLNQGTTSATLSGSGTGTHITYGWTQSAGPVGATITSPAQASTTVTGLITGTYTFLLTVTDSINNTATSSVNVTVGSPPTANAGPSRTLISGTTSTALYGSGTGSGITYHWTQTAGGNVTIATPSQATANITGLNIGTYTFQLTVTDGSNNTATSSANVTIFDTTGNHLLNGLISYWNLDESTGRAMDVAGGGNDGTNTADTLHVPGEINTAYGFNGTSSKIDMTNAANLSLTTVGTISAWVYLPVIDSNNNANRTVRRIVSKGNTSTDVNGYSLEYNPYTNSFQGEFATASAHLAFNFYGTRIVARTWYHLVVTWDGTHIITYLNGSAFNPEGINQTVTPVSNVYPFAIGYQAATNTGNFIGRIDEVGIWNRALSAAQVTALYSGNFGYTYPFVGYQGSTPVGVISVVPSQPLITNDVNTSVTAYPNPYSSEVNFNMKSSVAGRGSLTLYDLLGRKVATVFEGDLQAGSETKATYRLAGSKRQVLIYLFIVGDKTVQGKLIPGGY
jgi:hypothetical protein